MKKYAITLALGLTLSGCATQTDNGFQALTNYNCEFNMGVGQKPLELHRTQENPDEIKLVVNDDPNVFTRQENSDVYIDTKNRFKFTLEGDLLTILIHETEFGNCTKIN